MDYTLNSFSTTVQMQELWASALACNAYCVAIKPLWLSMFFIVVEVGLMWRGEK